MQERFKICRIGKNRQVFKLEKVFPEDVLPGI